MKLQTNIELFKDAVSAASQRNGIQEIFIEKDYWVTLVLKTVFEDKIGKETIFKGGTALSKCNSLIKRFSEDIDLVILRNPEGTGQQKLIDKYEMNPFEVNVLSPKRTFCEKIMSLVRFSYSDNPINDLRNKIRHIYDIHILLKDNEINVFFNSTDFDKMLQTVGNDDVQSFKNNNEWLKEHPVSAIIFDKPKFIWEQLKNIYNTGFKELVFGELPANNEILETLKIVSERLRKIKWKIG